MLSQSQQYQKKLYYTLLAAAVVIAGLAYVIPVAGTVDNPAAAHWRMSFTTLLTVLITSSAVWFMRSLRQFKVRLRKAYILLGVGLICFSIAMSQTAIIGLLDQWDSAWATGGGLLVPFLIGTFFMYLSMWQFARLQSVKGVWTSLWVVTGMSVAVAAGSGVLASYVVQYQLDGVTVYEAVMGWAGALALAAALLARKIGKNIGPSYGPALRWQAWAFFAFTLGAIHEIVTTWFLQAGDWYEDYGVYLWGFIAAAALFLRASYEFRLLTARGEVSDAAPAATTDRDYLESLITVASLASSPRAIDPIMDDMRFITSSLPKGGQLSAPQKSQLVSAYRKLEEYLTHQDPLRTYTQEEVREQVSPGFMLVLKTGIIPSTPDPIPPVETPQPPQQPAQQAPAGPTNPQE
ncbi:MAG TPA: hypothetical protein VLF62_00910 [Candidatus Saccharimonadales bacterium]|nr:hypothetical protein [Candidatus Saccharimonadales bacterium]